MAQGNPSSNWFVKILGSAALAGLVAIIALIFQVNSSRNNDRASETEQAYLAIQVAKQETLNALLVEQNQIQSEQITMEARKSTIEGQTPLSTNNPDFALTATAFIVQATQVESTRQAIATKQKGIESTQTAISLPQPTLAIVIRAEDVIPQIKGENGGVQKFVSWWSEVDYGGENGELDPSSPVPNHKCFGMAWNTNQYGYHRLIVFQKPTTFTFAAGGWYVKVCIPDNIVISTEDVGKIQADWLGKRSGIDNQPWQVIVIQ